ncbi:GspE/PulE family protein [Flocculibacter collagenilyticus]|uniref:GspE/PulE family protein n=1 Tax=Flocculibacter collagenilyticus TaxID=2744479 RepID=UPI0018F77E66|nr:GspE/PulE family protein [Flocculibacter collagenilyticus]
MAAPRLKLRLGDLLVHEDIISETQLQDALQSQKATGKRLGATLVDLNYLTEEQLLTFLAQQLNLPFLDISNRALDSKAVELLPEVHARRHRAIVLEDRGDSVLLGLSEPANLAALDQLGPLLAPKELELAVIKESQILEACDNFYRKTHEIEEFAHQLQEEYEETADFDFNRIADESETSDATVVKLLQTIFEDAVQMRASDIHIEPDEKQLRIRKRVDGVLNESLLNEISIASALVLRLKLMAGLDISEKRLPQDGRFHIKVKKHNVDVRISTMPIQNGESVVMRLLDQSAGLLTLAETGMPDDILSRVSGLIKRPHGMILVTGPTGSGKTTTLYGILSELNKAQTKIITVEDPVEYRLPRINQVQVNSKIGLDFSNVLRTTLRQDPDIIMVGEMRDHETVEIGLRGALTGHLVLSTLHTNDAISSVLRLIDMGAAPYLVASSLRAIMAQRLVRRVCAQCTVASQPDHQQQTWLASMETGAEAHTGYVTGTGCRHCNNTGYKGRIGVFELLELDDDMMDALRQEDTHLFATICKQSTRFKPLAQIALGYAKQGMTTLDEVFKVAEHVVE